VMGREARGTHILLVKGRGSFNRQNGAQFLFIVILTSVLIGIMKKSNPESGHTMPASTVSMIK